MSKPLKRDRRSYPTREIRKKVIRILESGQFREFARRDVQVSSAMWARWIKEGKAEIEAFENGGPELGLCGLFVQAIEKAESRAHDRIFKTAIVQAGPDAQRWYLTKRFPEVYSGQTASVVDDRTGQEIEADPRAILIEKLKSLRDES